MGTGIAKEISSRALSKAGKSGSQLGRLAADVRGSAFLLKAQGRPGEQDRARIAQLVREPHEVPAENLAVKVGALEAMASEQARA